MRTPAALGLLFLALGCSAPSDRVEPPERIVLVVVDTLRRDHLGVYGGIAPTPHIDGLAANGTVFRRALAAFHSTPTSMGALFTGRSPSLEGDGRVLVWNQHTWCGLARFADGERDACVPEGLPTLAERMRERGYWTAGVHSHPLLGRDAGFARGFQRWQELPGASRHLAFGAKNTPVFAAARAGRHVNAAVEETLDARPSDRFFLYVHYLDAHDWHLAHQPYTEAVTAADAVVGELLALLEERGLRDGSVIVLTSDHGESLGERHFQPPRARHAGNPSFETVLRVPLVVSDVRLPGADDPIRGDELHGLLVRLAGGEVPAPDVPPGEQLVTESRWRVYRSGRWKSYWPRTPGAPRLVDLSTDPEERHDVASEHPEVLAAHRRAIEGHVARLALAGKVDGDLDPEQRERLRALGYLEPAYDLDTPAEAR
ncbi:MAG: sulfatase [Myxococcota bacterium]